MIFGGTDRLQFEFEEKFVARHATGSSGRALYEVHASRTRTTCVDSRMAGRDAGCGQPMAKTPLRS